MDEEQFRKRIGERIMQLRKEKGMTQLELAERLNYSDKSISKWERGEGLPDLYVFYSMAELFGVRVDDLIYDQPAKPGKTTHNNRRIFVPLLSMGLVWLVTSVVFCVFSMLPEPLFDLRLAFVYAIPISSIVLLVFACLWWNYLAQAICVSVLTWSACLTAYLTVSRESMRFIFITAAVFQVLTVLWFVMRQIGKQSRHEKRR